MKTQMKDLFGLPVEIHNMEVGDDKADTCFKQDRAAELAINSHNELVDMLERVTDELSSLNHYVEDGPIDNEDKTEVLIQESKLLLAGLN